MAFFFYFALILGRGIRKSDFGHMRTAKPRSDCADAQSDLGLHCPLTESFDTAECINREQMPRGYLAHVQDDLNLRILRMLEDIFSLDAPPMSYAKVLFCRDNVSRMERRYRIVIFIRA